MLPTYCVAKISWALVLTTMPNYPTLHTEMVTSPSCFVDELTCEIAKNATQSAFEALGRGAENTAACIKQGEQQR